MKHLVLCAILLAVVGTAAALDFGIRAPAKPTGQVPPPPDPAVLRQGGDTILDAVMVNLPIMNVPGTTVGYTDDYDEICPYGDSTSPDVVYTFVPQASGPITVDLFGSAYDTKVYVYDEDLALVACNDDFYADYTSYLEMVPVSGGVQYFVVVDGYGGAAGDYLLTVWDWNPPCHIECPLDGVDEGEPPLAVDYEDTWNGGCNTDPANPPLQPLTSEVFCGVTGWYLRQGSYARDTDWFTLEIPATGYLEIAGDAEYASYMFELGPQDCDVVAVIQYVSIGPCSEATMTIVGAAGATVWFWVGAQTFESPDGLEVQEYDYLLTIRGGPIATEDRNWTGVKALFR